MSLDPALGVYQAPAALPFLLALDALDRKDPATLRHCQRVALYAGELARALGWSEARCRQLQRAGLLHDIGKLALPTAILNKAGPLTTEEFALVRTHPARGAALLAPMEDCRELLPWVRAHHERWDGSGYPDGLSGGAIPEQARILAIADSFDAMTSRRSYRRPLGLSSALEELRRGMGSQFDPELTEVFLTLAAQPGFLVWERPGGLPS